MAYLDKKRFSHRQKRLRLKLRKGKEGLKFRFYTEHQKK